MIHVHGTCWFPSRWFKSEINGRTSHLLECLSLSPLLLWGEIWNLGHRDVQHMWQKTQRQAARADTWLRGLWVSVVWARLPLVKSVHLKFHFCAVPVSSGIERGRKRKKQIYGGCWAQQIKLTVMYESVIARWSLGSAAGRLLLHLALVRIC